MDIPGIVVLFHARAGKRDAIKEVWERNVKRHAADNPDLICSLYNYGAKDPDLIVLMELMSNNSVLPKAFEQSWFQQYLLDLEPLLSSPPQMIPLVNVWRK